MANNPFQPDQASSSESLTQLLRSWADGDKAAFEELLPRVYNQLKSLARQLLSGERSGHTLSCTALVHEAYLRLVDQVGIDWQGRAHFFGAAAVTMRRILVDHARARNSQKRGEGVTMEDLSMVQIAQDPKLDVLELDLALTALAAIDPERAKVVELRYFAGLSIEETAMVVQRSPATVKRDWTVARAWLYREIMGEALE